MAFDFKKEYKALYSPKAVPELIDVPTLHFFAVEGSGDPNEEGGQYSKAVELLYALSYTVKMSYKGEHNIPGYFEYVVPPLEGLWWIQENGQEIDYRNKSEFRWISMIRQPDFVSESVFEWAGSEVRRKKKLDTSSSKFMTYEEGLCVQMMHTGSFDEEPATILKLDEFIKDNHYINDIGELRKHHEIYLSDPRKADPEKMKTIIRHPIRLK